MEVALIFISERPKTPFYCLFLHVSVPWKINLGILLLLLVNFRST